MNPADRNRKADHAPGAGLSPSRRQMLGLMLSLPLFTVGRAWAGGDVLDRHPWLAPLVDDYEFDRKWLDSLLSGLTPNSKILALMDKQAEALPYHLYRQRFVNRVRIDAGIKAMARHKAILEEVERTFFVPREMLTALWGVETFFGKEQGREPILATLFTLATAHPRRAEYFRMELIEYLLLCREEKWDPKALTGSFAGAMGQPQMLPSSARRFGVDQDGDGKKNLFTSVPDTLASIAFYLRSLGWNQHGRIAVEVTEGPKEQVVQQLTAMAPWSTWRDMGFRMPPGVEEPDPREHVAPISLEWEKGPRYYIVFSNFRVTTQWNRSFRFAMAVTELSEKLRVRG